MDVVVDPKRTVRAQNVHVFEQDGSAPNGLDNNQPGDCQRVSPDRLMFTCPGCNQWGGVRAFPPPKKPEGWVIVSGSLDDVTSLTLSPSINCVGCCSWHGYLTDGVFTAC